MNLLEYLEQSKRTQGDKFSYPNALLGMIGELGEISELIKKHIYHGHALNMDKLTGEVGDYFWYLAQLINIVMEEEGADKEHILETIKEDIERTTKSIGKMPKFPSLESIIFAVNAANNFIMETIFDKHSVPTSVIIRLMASICVGFDLDIEEVFDKNIEKLKLRYPEGFSTQASIERKDVE